MKILFLEDDPVIGDIVSSYLAKTYEIKHCFDSNEALGYAENEKYDLYIFDINVPGISGIELLKSLREFNDTTPAIFITAYQELKYLKEAFGAGANDFIRKPFELEELQARVENLKELLNIDAEVIINDSVSFNMKLHQITKDKKELFISAKESEILHYLIKNRQRVISSDELLQNLWEYESMPSGDAIRTYIKSLRSIIGKEHIVNIRGEGYKFQ